MNNDQLKNEEKAKMDEWETTFDGEEVKSSGEAHDSHKRGFPWILMVVFVVLFLGTGAFHYLSPFWFFIALWFVMSGTCRGRRGYC